MCWQKTRKERSSLIKYRGGKEKKGRKKGKEKDKNKDFISKYQDNVSRLFHEIFYVIVSGFLGRNVEKLRKYSCKFLRIESSFGDLIAIYLADIRCASSFYYGCNLKENFRFNSRVLD